MLSREDSEQALEATANTIRACTLCRLHKGRTFAVPGEGPVFAPVLLVGEAPGRDEDATGRPFVGSAGRILEAALTAARLPRSAVFITNVVKCRPPKNRRPRRDEVSACRMYLMGQIACVQPRVIVTLGATALRGVLGPGHELKDARRRRLALGGIPVVATYHPAAILYNRRLERRLRKDLNQVARSLTVSSGRHKVSGRRPSRARRATH